MDTVKNKHWHVIRTIEIAASAVDVWEIVGGFYTIHLWHPDISETEISPEQTETHELRRILIFPGQPKTTEELIFMDNENYHYRYKWFQGAWGEDVKNYHASLRVISGDLDKSCILQWESEFDYPTDAISDFYLNGFRELEKRFVRAAKE